MEFKDLLNIFSYKKLKKLIQIILNCLIAVKISDISPQLLPLSEVISLSNLYFILCAIGIYLFFHSFIGGAIFIFINFLSHKIKSIYVPVNELNKVDRHPKLIKWINFLKIISDNKYMELVKSAINNTENIRIEAIELLVMLSQLGFLLNNIYVYIMCVLLLILFSRFAKPLSFAEKNKELFIYILNNERSRNIK